MNKRHKILVVDDIEMNRAMLIKIFAEDYTVLSACNGKEALAIMRQDDQEINMVLLDLSMPEMDGYEVIIAMKADQKLAAIPIVVTTGAIDKSERRAFDLGADDFIIKPYDPYIVRKGSLFTVDLPFTVSKELPEISPDRLKEVRALIIDDDLETQEYGKKMMTKLGITCDIANSGGEALALMQEAFDKSQGYDICFVDWRMPRMSGIDITRAIRATFDDDTVIVVASAYDIDEIVHEAKMAGANIVVPKPMFQSTVFDLLMNITGGSYNEGENHHSYNFNGKKILLAEDNTLNAEVSMELLKLVGFTTKRAVDGMMKTII